MTAWLDQISEVIDRRASDIRIYFRDDDAGWDRPRLMVLLDLFARYGTPIDLAVIPDALDADLAAELVARRERFPELLGLHQHGYRHLNHELLERKCEFGVSRSFSEQEVDIRSGRERLIELFGNENLDNIFTPPWNRCTQTTVDCLTTLGFHTLSREWKAVPLDCADMFEFPVHVDWCKATGLPTEKRVTRGEWIATAINRDPTAGIMLHHAAMNEDDFADVEQLLKLLKKNGDPQCYLMSQLIEQRTAGLLI